MISKELIKKIKRIEIKSNSIANDLFSDEYHSIFKGNGMEFEDIREYYIGDDVRSIDWNVTARQGKAYIKQFREERELNMFLLIDISQSNYYGKKRDTIAELGATLAFSAVKNNDKIGSLFFTDKVEKMIPSKKGKKHVLSIIENILDFHPQHSKTDIKNALKYFNGITKKRSIVFLISDFMDTNYEKELKMISRKHDLILIRVIDKGERKLPKGAIFSFRDMESGEEIVINNLQQDLHLDLNNKAISKNLIEVHTDKDYIKPLQLFFKRRR